VFVILLLYLYHQSSTDYKYTYAGTSKWQNRNMAWWVISQWISSNQFIPEAIYVNLVVSSSGLTRFNPVNAELNPISHLMALLGAYHILHVSRISVNLPGPSSSSRMDVSSFGCVSSLSLYLVLNFVISSRTVDICRSVCRSLFGIYHGVLTIVLRTLFWNFCNISIFELLAVPHRVMP
jgi:hypothetical protein